MCIDGIGDLHARQNSRSNKEASMTFEKLQYPPRSAVPVHAPNRTIETALSSSPTRRRFLYGSLAALSVGVFMFVSPNHAETMTMTTSDTDAVVVATAA